MTGGRSGPRPARSRARLLDSATALLRAGGPSAVTVDAVLRGATVARATLYRHFPSGNDLLAAAFQSLIPPAPTPPEDGTLRERLMSLLQAWAAARRGAHHAHLDVLGRDLAGLPEGGDSPLVTAKLSTLTEVDFGECARAAVEGFLHVYGNSANDESVGA
jgi:AcrR family transcriptional regulator